MARQCFEHPLEHPDTHPSLEAPMAGLVRRESLRQVLPRRTGAQDPQHPVHHLARIALRSTALAQRWFGEVLLDERPLLVGELLGARHARLLEDPDGKQNLSYAASSYNGFLR
jgi:hypothetical protein